MPRKCFHDIVTKCFIFPPPLRICYFFGPGILFLNEKKVLSLHILHQENSFSASEIIFLGVLPQDIEVYPVRISCEKSAHHTFKCFKRQ